MKTVTLYEVIREHGLGTLASTDPEKLRAYQRVLTERITMQETRIQTENLFFAHIAELNTDLRWYRMIQSEIGELLTQVLHTN